MTRATIEADAAKGTGTGVSAPGRAKIDHATLRTDRWWVAPLVTFTLLTIWVAYAMVRTMSQRAYYVDKYDYLSPFSSPCLTASCHPGSRDLGTWFGHFPPFLPFALLILPVLLGFRLTCYYYRRTYYRAFWLSPPACAVPEPHSTYTGERRFPLILQNAHRYFFYAALLVSALNTYDAVRAFKGGDGGAGIGLGSIIITINVVLLWTYTLSCHSCRHVVGGRLKHFSAHPLRYRAWSLVSKLNTRHMQLAWTTLATLMITDGYIALVASGAFADPRIYN